MLENEFSQIGQVKNVILKDDIVGIPAMAIIEFKDEKVVEGAKKWHFNKYI